MPQNYQALKFLNMDTNKYVWQRDDVKNLEILKNLMDSIERLIERYLNIQVEEFEREKDPNVVDYQVMRDASEMAKKK
uniref:Uncharacterized protein n=1 Tax=Panagrolaimus sp. JU765 TaxID=591449 RepID=A0AC34Q4B7_9BILA